MHLYLITRMSSTGGHADGARVPCTAGQAISIYVYGLQCLQTVIKNQFQVPGEAFWARCNDYFCCLGQPWGSYPEPEGARGAARDIFCRFGVSALVP